ncbi:MAG TPA: CHAT domain-containing tetratricopeptide repeat protein [Bryobacteraceae bacterium]|nr:CHAT domain-containing tetratricopeptide repeat protein [Bryobacteraceae bacterium]
MKTGFLVSLLCIIPLAGTLERFVPPPRTPPLARPGPEFVFKQKLTAQYQQSYKEFSAGDFINATALAQQGYRDARQAHEPQLQGQFLLALGNCQFALHQYRPALQTYVEARHLAESSHDNVTAGKLDLNISSVYSQLGQIDAATEAIGRALARLTGPQRLALLPKIFAYSASLQADQGRLAPAADLYRQAIAAADRAGDQEMYALAWNELGYAYLEHEKLSQAEHPLLEAYRVRELNHQRTIEGSYRNLGMLRLAQGDAGAASTLLDRAVELSKQPGGLRPNWEVYYARGCVRLQQNRLQDALDDLRISARLARNWRREAFSDDATRISAENMIQKVHSALMEAGNRLYFATHLPALARETFESAEANRAASLRALLAEPRDWWSNLPAAYWETLGKLEAAEAKLLRSSGPRSGPADEQVRQLRGALIEWESQAGSATDVELPDLLEHTRKNLPREAAFFAFHLSSPDSYLWAVSHDGFALYRLPPGREIAAQVERFNKAVHQERAYAQTLGAQIYRMLFSQLGPAFGRKPRWLLALDAQLFDLPFAALVEETGVHGPVYVAEHHSLQIASGAGMLSPASPGGTFVSGPFVAVADPVYNIADPRWGGSRPSSWFGFFTARAGDSASGDDLHLARLAGSAREVADCAAAWGGSSTPVLLEGAAASRRRLQTALTSHPAVLHFATHVLQSSAASRSGFIVLSLTHAGQHEILGPAEIATWDLNGALVSLSGCSSGSADVLPATGMMGLTRACQAAGAAAVVASRWPTPDDTGAFFLSFYRYLRALPHDGPAVALQRAQIAMLRSGTWRSNPNYWGAYFVTGNQP